MIRGEVPNPNVRRAIRLLEMFKLRGALSSSGMENIPRSGKALFAANHRSDYYDARVLGILVPRDFYIPAKQYLDDGGVKGKIMKGCGALFFDHESDTDRNRVFNDMGDLLDEGRMIGMFIEGTSKNKGPRVGKAQKGAANLAIQHRVDIIPIGIGGTELEGGQKPKHIHVACGDPLSVDIGPQILTPRERLAAGREISEILRERVQEMFDFARELSA